RFFSSLCVICGSFPFRESDAASRLVLGLTLLETVVNDIFEVAVKELCRFAEVHDRVSSAAPQQSPPPTRGASRNASANGFTPTPVRCPELLCLGTSIFPGCSPQSALGRSTVFRNHAFHYRQELWGI
ncbi:uncharacterized protein STEHIDRAFT_121675, partial [Stereum hirsutum FP-91666 SS1]|uniref:uncharacterized protein n=1 Tax=Stereum hirsutum (strain FP-91666) TaxID=721885 RepID=UPI0004449D6C